MAGGLKKPGKSEKKEDGGKVAAEECRSGNLEGNALPLALPLARSVWSGTCAESALSGF